MGKWSIVFLFCVISGLQYSLAQSTTGNIEGWIVDTDGRPVTEANVSVSSQDLQGVRSEVTDERGHFLIAALPAGNYTLRIGHLSYEKAIISDVRVLLGQTTIIGGIHMTQSTIEAKEVVVTGQREVIDARSASNSTTMASRELEALPLERNYLQASELLPHSNISFKHDGGPNFAGATGLENKYFIDGADVTDPTTGADGINLPYNFVREFQVKTGGYKAEYQSSLGGIVNSITYSGGNEVHGQLFGFFTNNDFNGTPRLASGQPPKGSFADYDIGASIGGPIVKDRLWYFVAYDPHAVSEDVPVTGLSTQRSYSTAHIFAGKLTWTIDQANRLTFSILGDPTTGHSVSTYASSLGLEVLDPSACNADYASSRLDATVNGMHLLADNLLLQSSLSVLKREHSVNPVFTQGNSGMFLDYVAGTASGSVNAHTDDETQQVQASIKGTLTLQGHQIKAGLQYQENSLTLSDWVKEIDHGPDPSVYYRWDTAVRGTVKQLNPSGFIQDSWQLSQRLCINAGVRWDPQWLIASDGTVAQKITDQIQPRIGVVFQPGELGTQKISASFGRFYQPVQLCLSTMYHIKGAYYYVFSYPNDPRVDTSGGTLLGNLSSYVTNVPDVKGQYFDEFVLGYERLLPLNIRLKVAGTYRWIGQGIEDGVVDEQYQALYGSLQVYGNPGSGPLYNYPAMRRKYTALEVTLDRYQIHGFSFMVTYVLSRNYGNYDGLAETNDLAGISLTTPNTTNQFGLVERMVNADGLLPNDRTHVLKIFGSYEFDFGLSTGVVFQWMSGTPLNEFGVDPYGYGASTFLQPRGTAGRTPSIWDLNFRFMYDVSKIIPIGLSTKLIVDVEHVASRRTAIDYDQNHYYDYAQTVVNPHYMVPVQFQPPMSMRLGIEVDL